MNRNTNVYLHKAFVGSLTETDEGYEWTCEQTYLHQPDAEPDPTTGGYCLPKHRFTSLF